jgi:hypothetical protein
MRKENIKGQSPDFRKYAENSLNYEVKLKKFSLPTCQKPRVQRIAASCRRRSAPFTSAYPAKPPSRDSPAAFAMAAAINDMQYTDYYS